MRHDRGRRDAAVRHARGAPAAHARAHRRDALVPRQRPLRAASRRRLRARARLERRAGRVHRRRGRRVHRRHALQGLGRRRQSARPHDLHRPARLDHGHADGAAAARPSSTPATPIRRPSRASGTHNAFIRVWRGLDPEGSEPCTALGEPATLVLLGDDYDGGTKAWVRWPDGSDDIVPGSRSSAASACAPLDARAIAQACVATS